MGETANDHKVTGDDVMSRGIGHGWDSANYTAAYGHDGGETFEAESVRRAGEYYPGDTVSQTTYAAGFALGVSRFCKDRYPDGTRMD